MIIILGESNPRKRWSQRIDSTEEDPRVGQVLQAIVWWFCLATLDWCCSMLFSLFNSISDIRPART